MATNSWIAVVGIGLTLLLNLGGYLVAWGMLKNSVMDLKTRVHALEAEIGAVRKIEVQIGRIETRLDGIDKGLGELVSNLRWMRSDEVPIYEGPAPRGRRKS